MKKLLFIAMLSVAGFVSAKGNVEKVNSKAKEATVAKSTKKSQEKISNAMWNVSGNLYICLYLSGLDCWSMARVGRKNSR